MGHFAHYVKREIAQVAYTNPSASWFARNQPDDQGFERPSYHISRCTSGPAARIREGDSIWLFSQLRSPWGTLPPALDARIEVTQVIHEDTPFSTVKKLRFEAGKSSQWFPLFDAQSTLRVLNCKDIHGKPSSLLNAQEQPVGCALQSIREIHNGDQLETLAARLSTPRYDFISYRLMDGTRAAYLLAKQLLAQGRPLFWDRWSLPRRLAERREFLNHEALDRYISTHLYACDKVWGILSPGYDDKLSYAYRERQLAQELGKFTGVTLKNQPHSREHINT